MRPQWHTSFKVVPPNSATPYGASIQTWVSGTHTYSNHDIVATTQDILDFILDAKANDETILKKTSFLFQKQEREKIFQVQKIAGSLHTWQDHCYLAIYTHTHTTADLPIWELPTCIGVVKPSELGQWRTRQEADSFLNKIEEKKKDVKQDCIWQVKNLLPVAQGEVINRYWPTADKCPIEEDVDEVVYGEDLTYQNVEILHLKQFGNISLLVRMLICQKLT